MTETRWRRTRRAYLRLHPVCVAAGCGRPSALIVVKAASPLDHSLWRALCGTHYAEHLVDDDDPVVAAQAKETLRVLCDGRVRRPRSIGRAAHDFGRAIAVRLHRGEIIVPPENDDE